MVLRCYGENEDRKNAAFCLKDPLFCNGGKAVLSPFFDVTPLLPEGGNEREGENRHSMSKWFWGGDQSELGKRGSCRAASHTVRTVEYRERLGEG